MPKRLLVVESPGKVKKLSQILGSDWIVRASCGHIRELSNEGDDSLGFTMEGNSVNCNYIPRDQRAKETIQQLKAAVRQVDEVVLATDPDREGETIAWHLKETLGLREPKRVIYTEITASAVQTAIAHPRKLDTNLIGAGLCRDCLDKLVGYKGSPLVWALNNGAKSVGRVQSATLHLICQREREIQVFVPQDYWSVWVDYKEGFRAFYKSTANTPTEIPEQETETHDDAASNNPEKPESKRVLSEAEATRLVEDAKRHSHQIIQVEGKLVNRQPPPPFTTSTLQQAAGSKLKFAPDKTMQVAQKLYEAGLITYMRTDSVMLSPDFCASARQWLEQNDPQNVPQQVAKHRSSKTAQEAHEAIRPTDVFRPSVQLRAELPEDEFNLYVMIWKRAIASQCRPAQVRKTLIITKSGNILWQARGQVIEFYGYAKYWPNLSKDAVLPVLQQGQILTLENAGHDQKQTQPPPRYSEPKLVQLMERKGIGRPSTYAPTVATLKKRNYVELKKDNLQPTALGLEVDEFLQKALPDLLEAEFTAKMEDALDAISEGKNSWQHYLTSWNKNYFVPALSKAKTVVVNSSSTVKTNNLVERKYETSKTRCPECKNCLAKIPSSKVKKKYFLKCVSGCENIVLFWSDFNKAWEAPKTKTSPDENAPKSLAKLTSYPCPVCKKPLEEYSYIKDGQSKTMLRCSGQESWKDKKHKDVAYFHTAKGWWSPKFGNLKIE
ncbi:type I DNA topoisomerase [Anabaena cylindrica FACHB-243]|uniref:DNA topoisomerase 1 n=1 Tax=Anabaena cylindrica (strain ATCC 27899 / PCC 7122) TaxID=272123 RepID=K9ZHN3_ANACC|nr:MULTISPECIES: type I DNA topoisomerase [Anabaena]AFZ57860.1 DNA topoisomerase I [Anabaena cylindrica PCC 7122]MBD2419785.1 type I DNA topoisomerase [Anabaena cylindrica FACHB-243]MBY5281511.1 type I DNA topoisomerase [Anabaena sp. CCAP 1446/1C]MBY5307235.1 type I DNA topoisomerase [Anabaena sp. CCAP 1446/1C]MCM2405599.1 type I DNA topoisomerase [Anabaena sp. CCAP 1446/1C]